MAKKQQVYIMQNQTGLVKIGISNNPEKRCREISNASGIKVKLIKTYKTDISANVVESILHAHFKESRQLGEWFESSILDSINNDLIKELSDRHKAKSERIRTGSGRIDEAVGNRAILKSLITDNGITRKQMSEVVMVPPTTLNNWLLPPTSRASRPCPDYIIELARLRFKYDFNKQEVRP